MAEERTVSARVAHTGIATRHARTRQEAGHAGTEERDHAPVHRVAAPCSPHRTKRNSRNGQEVLEMVQECAWTKENKTMSTFKNFCDLVLREKQDGRGGNDGGGRSACGGEVGLEGTLSHTLTPHTHALHLHALHSCAGALLDNGN